MKLYFWSIGKAHEPYVKEGIEIFTKRISHYYPVEWKIFPAAKNAGTMPEDHIKKVESIPLLSAIQPGDELIALDENVNSGTPRNLPPSFMRQQSTERKI